MIYKPSYQGSTPTVTRLRIVLQVQKPFSIFILVCWSIINIVDDNILDPQWLWLGNGARHPSFCRALLKTRVTFSIRSSLVFQVVTLFSEFSLEQVRCILNRIDVTCAPFLVLIMLWLIIISCRIDDYSDRQY